MATERVDKCGQASAEWVCEFVCDECFDADPLFGDSLRAIAELCPEGCNMSSVWVLGCGCCVACISVSVLLLLCLLLLCLWRERQAKQAASECAI